MKVIMINGSPNANGCTFTALSILKEQLALNRVDSEIFQIGKKPVRGCIDCRVCKQSDTYGKCAFNDDLVNKVAESLAQADGLIIGSPVHYASASGAVTSFCDRLFFSTDSKVKRLKFGAAIVCCRRSGNTTALDQLNKYFTISQMPVVSSSYWNGIYATTPEDVYKDVEGVLTLKNLANNMAYLIKCKYAGNVEPPVDELANFTRNLKPEEIERFMRGRKLNRD
ncbi:MAG TPA: flavodoxin family protein [Epulopiscium sp.]|nr:flavodoxin family protein [Candidatus Epulonipiscium sp.]